MTTTLELSGAPGTPLTVEQVRAVARDGARVELGREARGAISASREALEGAMRGGAAIYGVNTGFGSLSRQRIPADRIREMQRNLIRSHASGVGGALPEDVVRGMMVILAASLARGRSGVRVETVEGVLAALNAGVTPVVPEVGSVGASGDLAPLAHVALALMGEGEAWWSGKRTAAADALKEAGLKALELDSKEGLALINGTHLMASQGALLLADWDRVWEGALAACAMSMDAARATDAFLDARVYEVRAQPGPVLVAARLRELLAGSQILPAHAEDDPRVQDPYSFRCAPMVLGAAWDAMEHVRGCVERELGAVTDNPLIFPPDGGGPVVVSAGCFHGMPIAIPLDIAAIAVAHVGGISERRVYHMLSATDPQSLLPAHLSPSPGLHSGLMIVQYAAAACVNEMATLAGSASVVNVPTCAGMEDYNSMGPRSAAKARRSLELCRSVVAIELLTAAEGLERQRPLRSGAGVERAHGVVRGRVSALSADRPPSPDIAAIEGLIRNNAFVRV